MRSKLSTIGPASAQTDLFDAVTADHLRKQRAKQRAVDDIKYRRAIKQASDALQFMQDMHP